MSFIDYVQFLAKSGGLVLHMITVTGVVKFTGAVKFTGVVWLLVRLVRACDGQL